MISLFKKHEPKTPNPKPFRPILPTTWMAEYAGGLPRTPTVLHRLYCVRLTPGLIAAMDDRHATIGGLHPTHMVYCSHFLYRDKNIPRLLFGVGLDLSKIYSDRWQDWIAFRVTAELRMSLLRNQDLQFLIRCNSAAEFPWCQSPEILDDYWLTDAKIYYQWHLKSLIKIGVLT